MTTSIAYAVLAELVAIREWDPRTMLAASEYDEFCARCDAAWAAARACVARGDVTVPREPTIAMVQAGLGAHVLNGGAVESAPPIFATWRAMHDAATKENTK